MGLVWRASCMQSNSFLLCCGLADLWYFIVWKCILPCVCYYLRIKYDIDGKEKIIFVEVYACICHVADSLM